jgi:hypothetical protein
MRALELLHALQTFTQKLKSLQELPAANGRLSEIQLPASN